MFYQRRWRTGKGRRKKHDTGKGQGCFSESCAYSLVLLELALDHIIVFDQFLTDHLRWFPFNACHEWAMSYPYFPLIPHLRSTLQTSRILNQSNEEKCHWRISGPPWCGKRWKERNAHCKKLWLHSLAEQPGRNMHTGFSDSRYWRRFCGMREWVRILQKPCGCWGHDLLTFCHWQFTGRMKGSFCKGLSHKAFSSEWGILCPALAKFKLHPC